MERPDGYLTISHLEKPKKQRRIAMFQIAMIITGITVGVVVAYGF